MKKFLIKNLKKKKKNVFYKKKKILKKKLKKKKKSAFYKNKVKNGEILFNLY